MIRWGLERPPSRASTHRAPQRAACNPSFPQNKRSHKWAGVDLDHSIVWARSIRKVPLKGWYLFWPDFSMVWRSPSVCAMWMGTWRPVRRWLQDAHRVDGQLATIQWPPPRSQSARLTATQKWLFVNSLHLLVYHSISCQTHGYKDN